MIRIFLLASLLLILLGFRDYTTGFFLTRYEITHKASLSPLQPPAQYSKIIILLVDALRFDFVYPQPTSSAYSNKLTTLTSLLSFYPNNTLLMEFISDPPTVTMQRIKGITTGSLPTFIDFKDNLQSDRIQEDTILYQMKLSNKKSLFVGDMIWLLLLPDGFTEAYPYDSHNVRDLDTVDNGVYEYFRKEAKNEWDLIIGHMLGVDHVGHRYHANHPEMTRKLLEINEFINETASGIDNSTLLLVFGDHGMTDEGNHGGATVNERNSILFAYSKTPFIQGNKRDKVPQIDIVPTLSILLGVGIPFNSLGALIPELFQNETYVETCLFLNAQQISRYLDTYDKSVKKLPDKVYEHVQSKFFEIEKGFNEGKLNKTEAFEYIYMAGNMCRDIWTTFDYWAMTKGAITVGLASIAVVFVLIYDVRVQNLWKNIIITASLCIVSPLIASGYWLWAAARQVIRFSVTQDFWLIFSLYSLHGYSLFSNSYILKEDQTARFLLQGLLFYTYSKGYSHTLLLCSICVRLSAELELAKVIIESNKSNPVYHPIIINFIPMLIMIFYSKLSTKLNLILVLAYWTIPDLNIQLLPKLVYLLAFLSAIYKRSRQHILPVILILTGPNSPLLILTSLAQLLTASSILHSPELLGGFIALSSTQYFYLSGHRCNIQSLIISSAFIGFDNYNPLISSTLLCLNTFASYFLSLFCLSSSQTYKTTIYVMVYFLISAGCTMMNTFVNGRHLMVWSIFAPKYIFDVIVFGIVWVFCMILLALNKKKAKSKD